MELKEICLFFHQLLLVIAKSELMISLMGVMCVLWCIYFFNRML